MHISTTKAKAHKENSEHKDQNLPKNLNGSKWTQIGLKMWPETLIFCCRNSTGTKHVLVEIRSVVRIL